jgi:hypothetical protein
MITCALAYLLSQVTPPPRDRSWGGFYGIRGTFDSGASRVGQGCGALFQRPSPVAPFIQASLQRASPVASSVAPPSRPRSSVHPPWRPLSHPHPGIPPACILCRVQCRTPIQASLQRASTVAVPYSPVPGLEPRPEEFIGPRFGG